MEQLYFIALLLWLSCESNCCIVQLEAEQGNSNGTQRYRGSASNERTILLHNGESIEHTMRASSSCGVTVSNVAYSNDGISDLIALSIGMRLLWRAFELWLKLAMVTHGILSKTLDQ